MKLNNLKIGVVENDDFFLEEVKDKLSEIELVSKVYTWKSAEIFLRDSKRKNLDILFLDIILPGMNGIDLVKRLTEQEESVKIIILTNMNSDEMIFNSIKNGALGYLLKSELREMNHILEVILNGGAMITPTIALRVFNNFRKPQKKQTVHLTDREKQILEMLVKGKTVLSLAKFLDLSEHTVNGYVKSIYKKLQVHNRSELVLKAQEYYLL